MEKVDVISLTQATAFVTKWMRDHRKTFDEGYLLHDCKVLFDYMSFEEPRRYPMNIFSYAGSHNIRMHINPSVWHIYVALSTYYWKIGLIVCEQPTTMDEYLDDIKSWLNDQYLAYLQKTPLTKKELQARFKCKSLSEIVVMEYKEPTYSSIFTHPSSMDYVTEPVNILSTGFDALDQLTTGLHKSDLVVVASRPAMGKTAMLLSLARHIGMEKKIPVGIFSLELSEEQLALRMMMNVAEVERDNLRYRDMDPDERTRAEAALGILSNSPIYVDDTPSISLDELRTKAEGLVRDHHVQCILIDYYQFIKDLIYNDSTSNLRLMHAIKQIAVDLNVAIVLFAQTCKRGFKCVTPDISEYSPVLNEVSDMFWILHRPEYYDVYTDEDGNDLHGVFEVLVAKNNYGSTGKVRFHFTPRLAKIV